MHSVDKKTSRFVLFAITYAILLAFALLRLREIGIGLRFVWRILFPLVLGGCIAFILSIPMDAIERLFDRHIQSRRIYKFKRPISLLLTLILFVLLLFIILFSVVPETVNTFNMIAVQTPEFFDRVSQWVSKQDIEWKQIESYISGLSFNWDSIKMKSFQYVKNLSGSLFSSTMGVLQSIFSGMTTFLLGFVFALYILVSKEALEAQLRRFLYAFFPEEKVEHLISIASLSHKTFASFLSSQCLEALILGGMFFVSMTIFRMPYALLISMVITVTALVPIVGSFIGMVFGAFLILMVSLMQAFWFIVLFLILQQIEGNLIYPIVVGGSMGLPSLWVLLAVLVGSGLMGIVGMIIFIPIFSVLYVLAGDFIGKRLDRRNIAAHKIEEQS